MAFDISIPAESFRGVDTAYVTGLDTAAVQDLLGDQLVFDFVDSTISGAWARCRVPSSGFDSGASINVEIDWHADTATDTGQNCRWEVYFWRLNDTDDADVTNGFNTTGVTINDAPHSVDDSHLTATGTVSNANADGITAGDEFYVLVVRDADDAGDTMAGDACLRQLNLNQT